MPLAPLAIATKPASFLDCDHLEQEEALLTALGPLQAQLACHPLYQSIRSIEALRLFMQSHVYAVWDFMSLLKSLQRSLTCVEVPWRPLGDAQSRRLINEIVLGEESDEYGDESFSHFELYLRAMESCGASTTSITDLLDALEAGETLDFALASAPQEAATFVRSTFSIITTGEPHRIAAAFTFGREDLIPEMFTAFIRELDQQMPGRIAPFRYYLERHIEMDGDEHGPMALAMLRRICVSERHWKEALESAQLALKARIALWDGIQFQIERLG